MAWSFPGRKRKRRVIPLEHVTTATFDERVLKCEKPVLVDFYAEWCGPCKKLGPVLEEFAKEHPEVRVVKVNVDENADLVARYEVKNMPSLLVIPRRTGGVAERRGGHEGESGGDDFSASKRSCRTKATRPIRLNAFGVRNAFPLSFSAERLCTAGRVVPQEKEKR